MSNEELKEKLDAFKEKKYNNLNDSAKKLFDAIVSLFNEAETLKKENKKLKDENFKLDYQNTRIKGALFEFEMNYYQDNLKGDV